jgi:hypothetical protein
MGDAHPDTDQGGISEKPYQYARSNDEDDRLHKQIGAGRGHIALQIFSPSPDLRKRSDLPDTTCPQ